MSDKTTEPVAYLNPVGDVDDDERVIMAAVWRYLVGTPQGVGLETWTPLYAAPSPQTTPLPAGFRDIGEVIAERESTPDGKAAMDAARARLPQTTPTEDEIMRLADDSVGCYWPSGRAALAAAVGRLVAERDELKRTVEQWRYSAQYDDVHYAAMKERAVKAERAVGELVYWDPPHWAPKWKEDTDLNDIVVPVLGTPSDE